MFERFTDRARRVLVLAQEEARLLNHNFIGSEHILLGLLNEGEGVAAKALEALGISLEAVREQVEKTIGPAGVSVPDSPPFTPRAKKVLELSLREALQLGHNYIGTEHMLLGLVRVGDGVGAQVLQTLGADVSRVRPQVITLLAGYVGSQEGVDIVDTLTAVVGEMVEKDDVPVAAAALFGWKDAAAVLLSGPLLADARTERSEADGVMYETCTYRPRSMPEISISVAGASVTRAAFDDYTSGFISDAEEIGGLGDAATYSAARRSLRVLAGSTLFVVHVRRHPEARRIAIAAAERAVANLAGNAGPSVAAT